jgi:hypothetical protein
MFSISSWPYMNVFDSREHSACSPLNGDYLWKRDSSRWMFSRCAFDDPLPEPPLPRAPVPGIVFPTPTDVPVPDPFDIPAPSPVDVPVQTPQDIPAPPSEWPDDPALKKANHGLRHYDAPINRFGPNAARPVTLLSGRQPIMPVQIRSIESLK